MYYTLIKHDGRFRKRGKCKNTIRGQIAAQAAARQRLLHFSSVLKFPECFLAVSQLSRFLHLLYCVRTKWDRILIMSISSLNVQRPRKSSMPSYFRVFWKEASLSCYRKPFMVAKAWVLSGQRATSRERHVGRCHRIWVSFERSLAFMLLSG